MESLKSDQIYLNTFININRLYPQIKFLPIWFRQLPVEENKNLLSDINDGFIVIIT